MIFHGNADEFILALSSSILDQILGTLNIANNPMVAVVESAVWVLQIESQVVVQRINFTQTHVILAFLSRLTAYMVIFIETVAFRFCVFGLNG